MSIIAQLPSRGCIYKYMKLVFPAVTLAVGDHLKLSRPATAQIDLFYTFFRGGD